MEIEIMGTMITIKIMKEMKKKIKNHYKINMKN